VSYASLIQSKTFDLNLIEITWMDIEVELGQPWSRAKSSQKLDLFLKIVWSKIPEERLEGLIRSMPERPKAIIDADGGAMPY
jgi:hypothetical protein